MNDLYILLSYTIKVKYACAVVTAVYVWIRMNAFINLILNKNWSINTRSIFI